MKDETQQIDFALCRSALYEALAIGFRSPTSETLERLIDEEQNQALMQIAAMLDVNGSNGKSTDLAFRIRQLSQCSNLETLEKSYRYLFGFTAHPKVPPYETEYGEEALFQQPQELGDLSGFYSAFGLKLNTFERVDHISCECEFLSFLARKEAYALEQNEAMMLEETRRAQRLFLKDHLGRFMPAFVKTLSRENPDGFYGRLGNLCRDFTRRECAHFNIPLGSEPMRLRPTEWMEEAFTCGSGEELIQISRKAAATMAAN
ncbi:MAG: TorD/DmsD family molecular chaperone [bacterium]